MKVNAPPPPKPPLVLVPFDDLCKPDLTDRSLIRGLMDTTALVMIMGLPKCGKTFLVLDMALHIALGWQWFGRRVRKGRVIYVAVEAGKSIKNRIAAFQLHYANKIDDAEVDFAAVTSPVDLCHLGPGDDVERLVKAIGKADVVIIDTVNRALAGGDENGPQDMGAFVSACDQLRDQLNCTVIAVHHLGKDPARGGRGHSLLYCAVDTAISVEKKDNDVSVATVVAQRDGPGGDEIAFTLGSVLLGYNQHKEPEYSCVIEQTEAPKTSSKGPKGQKRDLLDALDDAAAAHGVDIGAEAPAVTMEQWREQAKNGGRFEVSSFRTAWSRGRQDLIDDGWVGQRTNGGDVYVWRVWRRGKAQADGLGPDA